MNAREIRPFFVNQPPAYSSPKTPKKDSLSGKPAVASMVYRRTDCVRSENLT